jgi:hypothetical protein
MPAAWRFCPIHEDADLWNGKGFDSRAQSAEKKIQALGSEKVWINRD